MKAVEVFGIAVPERAIIGFVGDNAEAISRELRAALSQAPPHALTLVDYDLDARDPLSVLRARRSLSDSRQRGKTVLLASWNEQLLRELSDEIWWIEDCRAIAQGDPDEILNRWRRHIAARWRQEQTGATAFMEVVPPIGDGRAHVRSVELVDRSGQTVLGWMSGEEAGIRVMVEFVARVEDPVIGVLIRTRIGLNVYGTNTELERLKLGPRQPGDTIRLSFDFRCDLCPGEYTITVASHDPDGVWHEWLEDVVAFTVGDTRYTAGVANLRARVSWEQV